MLHLIVRVSRIACVAIMLVVTMTENARSQTVSPANTLPANSAPPANTSIYPDIPQFGGPNSVGGFLKEDNEPIDEYRWQGLQDALSHS